jgi:hypothetical protein
MNRPEHIHIISAGENIDKAYPAAIRDLPTITRTFVFADSAVYEISGNPGIEKTRQQVRSAVSQVKEISRSLSIPSSLVYIRPPAYPSACDAVLAIHRNFPGARYSFDLSGGSKPLCLALFALSLWLDSEVSSALDGPAARNIPFPARSSRALLSNPNYQTILAILIRTGRKDAKVLLPEWVTRQYIFKQLWSVYVPSRTKKVKPEDSPVQPLKFKRGRKPATELTHGTFSDFMRALIDAGLVVQGTSTDSSRQKIYRITESGEIAFRFFADPATNTLVRTMLEKQ